MIKSLITDVDGVLTDGKIFLGNSGEEYKSLNYKDLDTVKLLRLNHISFGIITGEANWFTEKVKEMMKPDFIITGCKDKLSALKEIEKKYNLKREQICYIGDGQYDLEAIQYAGIGCCPSNAITAARENAELVLMKSGGDGCLEEVFSKIINC